MCTGLVVNGDRPSPPRMYIRHLRSLVDHWQKNGWREAAQVLHLKENRDLFNCREKLVDHINGKLAISEWFADPAIRFLKGLLRSLIPCRRIIKGLTDWHCGINFWKHGAFKSISNN